MQDIMFLKPVFKERIWGGNKLNQLFNYNSPYEKTGEAWAISGHSHGPCMILNGPLKNQTLDKVYQNNPELFNHHPSKEFPLLTKIIVAEDDLSIQVHPDDDYATKNANDLGKTECWYVLDAEKHAKIIYGHRAVTKENFKQLARAGKWSELFVEKRVKKGDFIYVPAGTVHAIGKGVVILETQQSSDTTYRIYDYDRLDDQGKPRQLHMKEALDVVAMPHKDFIYEVTKRLDGKNEISLLISNDYFTVEHVKVKSSYYIKGHSFVMVSILEGQGMVGDTPLKKGDHFIIPAHVKKTTIEGNLEVIIAHP
jgi:mannose-6-phosphate isomerase